MELVFSSTLDPSYREDLERLVFFNPRQARTHAGIVRALDMYGGPEIVEDSSGLRLIVTRNEHVQCLFARLKTHRSLSLVGMIMFLRTTRSDVVVVHMAVGGRMNKRRRSGLQVVLHMVEAVRAAASRLRGVERVTVLYSQDQLRVHGRVERHKPAGGNALRPRDLCLASGVS